MTDGTVGALAILILIFATSTIVFLTKSILDRRLTKDRFPPPVVSKKREEFYVIKQPKDAPPPKPKYSPKYSVVSSNDIFELSELDREIERAEKKNVHS